MANINKKWELTESFIYIWREKKVFMGLIVALIYGQK